MAGTIWGPVYYGQKAWAVPDDLWATLVAAQRLLHLDLAGLYTAPTNLVSFPGAAVILVPVAALMDLAGIPIQAGRQGVHPGRVAARRAAGDHPGSAWCCSPPTRSPSAWA